jgi:hypothetical protein
LFDALKNHSHELTTPPVLNAVLYASAPELFNTAYRGSAVGTVSCLGRLARIVAPFAVAEYVTENNVGVLWLGAGGIWLAVFVMVFLPVKDAEQRDVLERSMSQMLSMLGFGIAEAAIRLFYIKYTP